MSRIEFPNIGLRLPAFWDSVKDLEPGAFKELYDVPFLLQLASLQEHEMLDVATGGSDPTISASGAMDGLNLLPWEETRVVTLTKRTDANAGRVTIGRSQASDVCVPSGLVSKLHAYVEQQGEEYLLTDVGSRNGTMVGGKPIAQHIAVPLEFGVEIGFADTRYLFVVPLFFHHAVTTLLSADAPDDG